MKITTKPQLLIRFLFGYLNTSKLDALPSDANGKGAMNKLMHRLSVHKLLFVLTFVFSSSVMAGGGAIWLVVDTPETSQIMGDVFESSIKITSWNAAPGAFQMTLIYDPGELHIQNITIPVSSEFFDETFIDESSFLSGATTIVAMQTQNSQPIETDKEFARVRWVAQADLPVIPEINLQINTMVDTSWKPVEVNVAIADLSATTESDSNGSGKSACFIATAAYGSYLHPHVKALRDFRDEYLITNAPGRAFVELYYRNSPPIAEWIRQRESARSITRWLLTPVVYSIRYPSHSLMILILILIVLRLGRNVIFRKGCD